MSKLVTLRYCARKTIQTKKLIRQLIEVYKERLSAAIATGDLKAQALAKINLDSNRETLLELGFRVIELGHHFSAVARVCDKLVPREAWLRALSVNESEWSSPDMLKYGYSVVNVVAVLDLENSATRDDELEFKPLKWCQAMAMFNTTKTNPAFGKVMHDECNKMFGGAFGDWQEPSELERLGVKQHAA